MKYLRLLTALLFMILVSCNVEPEPINYNEDECAYCKMKISDVRFGAEIVSSKGKIFKYDSAECLVRTYIENDKHDYAFIMVTDYSQPKTLIDATTACYFISENQPSPMGGFLSAYENKDFVKNILEEKGGKSLDFENLVNEYRERYQ
jgi:copper chaperone NosL